jgi:2-polyprenyl-3-methyl-5-hydroxy-6-metoxy-1,4-benzoquinol methylase
VQDRFDLQAGDFILEVASNDGYLLQYFQEIGCEVLGVEPAENVANIARRKKIPTDCEFFGADYSYKLISSGKFPKLVVVNNVLAHVPDINDFMAGLALLAKAGAIISIEAPSMKVMLEKNLFDTIYHEHFSYISTTAVKYLTESHGIELFDIEFLETHGGSNRYWLGVSQEINVVVFDELKEEEKFGLRKNEVHQEFTRNSNLAIEGFKKWCSERQGRIIGYGAAAKATVLLNAAKINSNEISLIFDNAESKQRKLIPGVGVQITKPSESALENVTEIMIFPWNIATEIVESVRREFPNFTGRFWVALPELTEIK